MAPYADAASGTPEPRPSRFGLSGKLLVLTTLFVMIAEVLIYVPSIANFRITWLKDRLAAAHMAALRGMDVIVLRPEGFALPPPIMEKARRAAALAGGSVRETADREEALNGAHIIYAKELSLIHI